MHASPYPAMVGLNAISGNPTDIADKPLNASSPHNGQGAGHGGPHNLTVPVRMTTAARALHSIHNGNAARLHYYQIEYK